MQPTQNTPTGDLSAPSRRFDGMPETGSDRRFFDLRESGYTGWIDQDGNAVDPADAPAPFVRTEPGDQPDATDDLSEVRSTLLATARYLSEHGWNQHELFAASRCVSPAACSLGALSMVCYGYPAEAPTSNVNHPGYEAFDAAVFHLDCYVTETFGPQVGGLVGFNDGADRTVAEILATLRNASSWTPGPAWASVPRCSCGDRMLLDTEEPFYVSSADPWDAGCVARIFTCRTCERSEYVDVTYTEDRFTVRMAFLAWMCQQPHDGVPAVAGCSIGCDTCNRYCGCDLSPCVLHDTDDGESPMSWDVPGLPTYAEFAGGVA